MKSKIIDLRFIVPFIILISLICNHSVCQDISKDELEKRALESFQNGSFDKAAGDYLTLHNLYPKEPRIAYYLGRSYLQSNQDLEEACNLLEFAAVHNYGDDAYFFLGRAYHLTYRFDDATMAFTTFKKTASKRLLKSYDVDYWIEVTRNAKESSTAAMKLQVIQKSYIPVKAFEGAFTDKIDGKYIYNPDELKSKQDLALNYQTVMQVNGGVKMGDYLYFASHSKNSKQDLDIYKVKRLTADNYSQPEPLSAVINTPYNEEYPFYDVTTGTLFFSSKGHNTTGGYDIFRSRFDSATMEWITPERLPFPINTPFDDFLYTLTKDNSGAIFLSNRNTNNKEYLATAYLIQSPLEYVTPTDINEIIKLAAIPSEEITAGSNLSETNNTESVKRTLQPVTQKNIPVETAAVPKKSDYDKLLTEALELQSTTDSINWAVKELQKKADSETNYQKKQELTANIITLNKEASRMQRLSKEKFNEAEKLHGAEQTNNIQKNAGSGKSDQSVSELNTSSGLEKDGINKTKTNKNEYSKGIEAASVAGSELNKGLQILNTSPYSKNNPIPLKAELPIGLVYRIQLGAFAGRVPENAFRGLTPITSENIKDKNVTKYYVGYFTSINEARKALESVKKYGYPDAFLVSYFNREKITIEKAREIEFAEK